MPWTPSDASRHKKGLTSAQAKVWAKVANAALSSGDDEGTAIKKANAASGRVSKRAVKLAGKDTLGRPLWRASSVFGNELAPFPNGFECKGKPKVKMVSLEDLRPSQPKLEAAKVNSMMADDTPKVIDVIESSKGPRIFDGHHRAAAALMQGKDTIQARVWQPNDEAVSKMSRPTPPELLTDDIEVIIPISKRDEDKRLVFGWMYLPTDKEGRIIVDKHDDFMLPEDLEETAYRYVDTSRTGGVMHLRESHIKKSEDKPLAVMSLVESMVFTPEKCEALGIAKNAVPNGAWWVGYRVNDGPIGDRVWDDVKNERLTAFSVHGAARRVPVGKNEGGQSIAPQQPQALQQAATQSVAPSAGGGITIQTGPQTPQGKMTRKRKKTVRPHRPANLDKAMSVLANSKG